MRRPVLIPLCLRTLGSITTTRPDDAVQAAATVAVAPTATHN